MEKIKNVFRPGHEKDDNVMYGTPESKNAHGLGGSHEGAMAAHPGVNPSDPGDSRAAPNRSQHIAQPASSTQHMSSTQPDYSTQTSGVEPRDRPGGLTGTAGGVTGQIFNPHGDKYDEARFPSSTSTADPESQASYTQQLAKEQLRTDPGVEKRNHGILRQILNPNGEKYDETAYGTTAHAQRDVPATVLQTDPRKEKEAQGGITRQILNPNGDKYDDLAYGTTASTNQTTTAEQAPAAASAIPQSSRLETNPEAEKAAKGGVSRQIVNPGGGRYDETGYGQTANVSGPTSTAAVTGAPGTTLERLHSDNSSTTAIKGGKTGPYARDADETVSGSSATGDDSHLGRDAALGTAGVAGLGAAGYEANKHYNDPSRATTSQTHATGPATTSTTTNERHFPLSGGATSTGPASSTYAGTQQLPDRTAQGTLSEDSRLGRDTAVAGGLVGAGAGAGALAHEHRTYGPHGTDEIGAGRSSNALGDRPRDPALDNATYTARSFHLPGDSAGFHHDNEKPHEGYVHHTHGPHASDVANRLDPHVPGEFPTESGVDRHLGREAALGGAGLGAAGVGAYELSQRDQPSTASGLPAGQSTATGGVGSYEMAQGGDDRLPPVSEQQAPATSSIPPHSQHHHGRDAAVAGGGGAAGVGAYELGRDNRDPTAQSAGTLGGQQPASAIGASGLPATQQHDPAYVPLSSSQAQGVPATAGVSSQPQPGQEHHHGRDTALADGGAGAYELGKEREGAAQAPQSHPQRDPLSTTTNTTTTTTTTSVGQKPTTTDPYASSAPTAAGPQQTSPPVGRDTGVDKHHHHGDGHNKLHKRDDPRGWTPEEKHEREAADKGEKKESLIHRILHPHKHAEHESAAPSRGRDTAGSTATSAEPR
ncbi:hypothetical protein Tdes44962_MAKER10289, partial [Teratosphaeria destructans]